MKKGFALLYVIIFLVLVSFIVGLIMINIASMSITIAQLPNNYKSIYGNQSVVSLGYMLIANNPNNQTATTITYYNNITYSATIVNQEPLPQGYTLYTVQGNFGQDDIEIQYIKDSAGHIYCVGWQ